MDRSDDHTSTMEIEFARLLSYYIRKIEYTVKSENEHAYDLIAISKVLKKRQQAFFRQKPTDLGLLIRDMMTDLTDLKPSETTVHLDILEELDLLSIRYGSKETQKKP